MAYATLTIYIEHNGTEYECEVEAEGTVSHGGSNSYGSDEPEWTDVDNIVLYNSRGKRVSKRVVDKIGTQAWDSVVEALIEADSDW